MSKKSTDQTRSSRAAAAINAQKAAERNRYLMIGGVVLLVVVLLVVVMAVVLGMNAKPDKNQKATPSIATSAADAGGTPAELKDFGIFVGDPEAPKTVTIYEDLQCPACANFEAVVGKPLAAAMDAGDIRIEYRMVGILDRYSTNDYSSRALNAALTVLDTAGLEAFRTFHDDLFVSQPAEGGPGFENDELIKRAVAAGADEDKVTKPIEDKAFAQWIVKANDAMSREGYGQTPTVLVDGEEVEQDKVLEEIQ